MSGRTSDSAPAWGQERPICGIEARNGYVTWDCGELESGLEQLGLDSWSHDAPLDVVAACQRGSGSANAELGLTSSTDLMAQAARHCTRDGSPCFRSITGELVQAEKLEFCVVSEARFGRLLITDEGLLTKLPKTHCLRLVTAK